MRHTKMIRALLPALLMTSQLAYGMCSEELVLSTSKQIGHEITMSYTEFRESGAGKEFRKSSNGNIENDIFYACKALPNNKNLVVVVFAVINENLTTEAYGVSSYDAGIYDLISVVIDTRKKIQIAKHLSIGALESNAVSLRGLTIDTGRYYLESGSIVFGVRSLASSNSNMFVASFAKLFLYKLSNNSLTVVLNDLEVENISGGVEDECGAERDINYDYSKIILSVSPELTNGMHDLELTEKKHQETAVGCSDKPNTITPTKDKKTILKYNGQKYSAP